MQYFHFIILYLLQRHKKYNLCLINIKILTNYIEEREINKSYNCVIIVFVNSII